MARNRVVLEPTLRGPRPDPQSELRLSPQDPRLDTLNSAKGFARIRSYLATATEHARVMPTR